MSRKDWDILKRDPKPIYTVVNEAAAEQARDEMLDKWASKYPAMGGLRLNTWDRFVPFLNYDVEIHQTICSTNAIESLNARFRRAVRARGHFSDERAALRCLYLTVKSLAPTGKAGTMDDTWKPALNTFTVTFADRWSASENI
ncbi:transposase, mutator-like family protein [Bifidobacterium biavatii DSM 23969]|uniref:Mutator family transposase n=1 Tax=Bifidobacterium biavatii DSM 23969 TaxID=1437608 RepID=A0A086ZXI5_9BIFI|nr:transposase, mutator-like family protein [Bifidobacterium biavatii DSM 23969]